MKLVREYFAKSVEFLVKKNLKDAKRSVEELLAHVLRVKRMDVYLLFDKPMQQEEVDLFREAIRRRASGEPYEYIVGTVDFYGLSLQVSSSVLIPRPETELLLPLLTQKYPSRTFAHVLDLCTGSGCLALGAKKAFPDASVQAVDISEKALIVAQNNAQRNGLEVQFFCGDLTTPLHDDGFDLVLSNPPYIAQKVCEELDPSVKDYEPRVALDGGEDGLLFYRRIQEELPPLLRDGAVVVLEIGFDQGEAVKEIFSTGKWSNLLLEKDWSGKDRFFFLEYTA